MDDDFNFNHVCPQYRTFIDMKYKVFNVMLGAFINLSENVEVKLDNIINRNLQSVNWFSKRPPI